MAWKCSRAPSSLSPVTPCASQTRSRQRGGHRPPCPQGASPSACVWRPQGGVLWRPGVLCRQTLRQPARAARPEGRRSWGIEPARPAGDLPLGRHLRTAGPRAPRLGPEGSSGDHRGPCSFGGPRPLQCGFWGQGCGAHGPSRRDDVPPRDACWQRCWAPSELPEEVGPSSPGLPAKAARRDGREGCSQIEGNARPLDCVSAASWQSALASSYSS